MNKFLTFLGVAALLFIILDLNLPQFLYTLSYIILFFSIVGIIVFYISTPYAFDKSLKKVKYFSRRYITDSDDFDYEDDDVEVDDLDEIDISQMNMKQLYNELNYYLKHPSPITLRGKNHVNQIIMTDRAKIMELRQNIEQLSNMNVDLSELNAGNILTKDYIRNYVANARAEMDGKLRLKDDQFNLERQTYLSEIDNLRLGTDSKREDVNKQRVENEKISAETRKILSDTEIDNLHAKADVNLKRAKITYEISKARYIKHVLRHVDINKLPSDFQSYIIASIFNPNQRPYDEFSMQEKINKYIEKQQNIKTNHMQSDLNFKNQQVDDAKIRNDFQNIKLEQERTKTRRR